MAGRVTRTSHTVLKGTVITVALEFEYPDEDDDEDWATNEIDEGPYDLVGDIILNVIGPGIVAGRLARGGNRTWREGVFVEANTPVAFQPGGPVRQVDDITQSSFAVT